MDPARAPSTPTVARAPKAPHLLMEPCPSFGLVNHLSLQLGLCPRNATFRGWDGCGAKRWPCKTSCSPGRRRLVKSPPRWHTLLASVRKSPTSCRPASRRLLLRAGRTARAGTDGRGLGAASTSTSRGGRRCRSVGSLGCSRSSGCKLCPAASFSTCMYFANDGIDAPSVSRIDTLP